MQLRITQIVTQKRYVTTACKATTVAMHWGVPRFQLSGGTTSDRKSISGAHVPARGLPQGGKTVGDSVGAERHVPGGAGSSEARDDTGLRLLRLQLLLPVRLCLSLRRTVLRCKKWAEIFYSVSI